MKKVLEKAALTLWVLAVFFSCLIVVVSLLPFSPVRSSLSFIEKEKLTAIVPQGWGFFTKNPQEERLNFYKRTPQGEWVADDTANASSTNLFGASRKSRLRGLELSKLLAQAEGPETTEWEVCPSTNRDVCLDFIKGKPAKDIDNNYPVKTICGPTLLTQQKPNPWAYNQAGFENGNEIKYLFMEVRCG
ncbi:SdpA family antimicrobial peptide system protein [Corynebacterium lehmanniae]|uniref:SdpA family antimicrobial peptide system protein n=1 Tax=Corynebacterium lehmanniae TaxID=2913497 RepID=A0ABT4RB50_9CORY|nr:SdpA family antimicrobial peptide system protein [Corynebacterium lehmanniae]MCZ9292782.1 SdpA family antimicrobial peptide system protein [Corynebacterium lehmanniae]